MAQYLDSHDDVEELCRRKLGSLEVWVGSLEILRGGVVASLTANLVVAVLFCTSRIE